MAVYDVFRTQQQNHSISLSIFKRQFSIKSFFIETSVAYNPRELGKTFGKRLPTKAARGCVISARSRNHAIKFSTNRKRTAEWTKSLSFLRGALVTKLSLRLAEGQSLTSSRKLSSIILNTKGKAIRFKSERDSAADSISTFDDMAPTIGATTDSESLV